MRNKIFDLVLYLVVTLCIAHAVFPQAEKTLLQRDLSFGVEELVISDPDSRISDFAVVGNSLFYLDDMVAGVDSRILLREMPLDRGPEGEESTIVSVLNARYLEPVGSILKYYDSESFTLNSYDPLTGAVTSSQPANYIIEARTFSNGVTIGRVNALGELKEKVTTSAEIDAMSKELPLEDFRKFLIAEKERAQELGKYEIALLGSRLEVKKPLMTLYKHEEIVKGVDKRSSLDQALTPRYVRMSPSQTIAAVFSKNLPGMMLFTEDGSVLAKVRSPGSGTEVPEDGPFPGWTILFQSDVIVADDHLLVADNARLDGGERTYVIWKIGFDGEVVAMYPSPYFVTRMVAAGGYLYLLGRENQFSRYLYP